MFKALNKLDGSEIIILDPRWCAKLSTLRGLDHQDALLCPYCEHPVRVRAGRYKRWHFAHKHLENCPYENEPPVLLQTRAVLYEWLVEKFTPGSVTLEKKLEHTELPRHIDCWVNAGTQNFAYWIFETRKSPRIRQMLHNGFSWGKAQVTYLFVADLLNLDPLRLDHLYLTTTERAFMAETTYDRQMHKEQGILGRSLHYLDPQMRNMITFRDLHLYHSPQLYRGRQRSDALAAVKVSLKTGEFLHPPEFKKLQNPIERVSESKEQPQTAFLPRRFRVKALQQPSPSNRGQVTTDHPVEGKTLKGDLSDQDLYHKQLPECIICGQKTGDYWYHDRTNNTCKCRICYREGKW